MDLDRGTQRVLLDGLAESYPLQVQFSELEIPQVYANLQYLSEHGLVELDVIKLRTGAPGLPAIVRGKITAKGLDFLADDGGLTAILGVVTIRLHEDTVRDLLLKKLVASSASDEEKSGLEEIIKKLPAKALETAADQLLSVGIDNLPSIVSFIHGLI